MNQLEFSYLPPDSRMKLTEDVEEELWHRVDEFGGVKALAEAFDYSASKIYGWKSKDIALPSGFFRQIMGGNNAEGVILVKGSSTGSGIRNPDFPIRVSDELLTRIEISVNVNEEGTPIYLADERSLVERFRRLLGEIGDIDVRVYSRSTRFELRYPKFVHSLISKLDFQKDFPAMVDEKGSIEDGKLKVNGRTVPVDEFEGELYSREKRFELALERGESGEIADMISEESGKVNRMLENN